MSSMVSSSVMEKDFDEKKTVKLYVEMDQRMKMINEKMLFLRDNFEKLASKSSALDNILTPMVIGLNKKYFSDDNFLDNH